MIVVIRPADTGEEMVDDKDVKYIGRGDDGESNGGYTGPSLPAFTNVTIRLIAPNEGDEPAKCDGKDIKSTGDRCTIGDGT